MNDQSQRMNNELSIVGDAASTRVRVPEHVTWHDVDADLVLFNQQDGTYHALDRTGSEVWRAVAREGRLGVVVAQLRQRYPDAAAAIDEDVRAFVERAARLGLLAVSTP